MPAAPDYPYVMRLKDGRRIFVEIPGKWMTRDRSGEIGFRPAAMRFLDRIQALALSVNDRPATPGYLATLRVALGMTQSEFAQAVGVHKLTVSRWERGTVRPDRESLAAVDKLRREAVRKGVPIPS
ncbi:MAG: helix-turn-helix domain-containing protein [Planctomycetes bacterium]|nr:helix-turn-helix domain-containing protein [Planctomycetota bacterium]